MLETTKLWVIHRLSQKSLNLDCSIFNQPRRVFTLLSIWCYNMALFWPLVPSLPTTQQRGGEIKKIGLLSWAKANSIHSLEFLFIERNK